VPGESFVLLEDVIAAGAYKIAIGKSAEDVKTG
jgi:hypothetical protein